MDARQQIKRYITANYLFSDDPGALADAEPLIDSGILDSMGVLELIVFIEKDFAVRITPEEMLPANFESVDAIHAFVRRKQSACIPR